MIRAKRKTISLQVGRDLAVIVRAPMRMPAAAIAQFVAQHEDWIHKQLRRMEIEAHTQAQFTFQEGDRLPVNGQERRLCVESERTTRLDGDRLILPRDTDSRAAVLVFLREEARQRVAEKLLVYAPLLGVAPTGVKITSATTRWGSCSGRNSLCFAYRAACLPERLLEYLVVHELSHIREHNHSARFWAVVTQILPDCMQRRAELREFQQRLPF